MTLPSRSITVKIGPNEYEIPFPKNGALIDMEVMKINLSKDTHSKMIFGTSSTSERAYLLIEAIVTFSVLIPRLKEDLAVKSLLDLDPYQSKELVNVYVKQFYPWFQEWMKIINEDEAEVKTDAPANS